jgi:phosphonate degradation associated HDIG domain protein
MRVIDDILERYRISGDRSYGEHVTQTAHMLQAAMFAADGGETDAMIAAALLHDVGHFIDDAGEAAERDGIDAGHESIGAAWLSQVFPLEVTAPIALHVAAKRYLCATEPGYADGLSDASRLSLRLQGGPFTPAEARAFAALPHARDGIRLRRYDDRAKQIGLETPALDTYRPLLVRLAARLEA